MQTGELHRVFSCPCFGCGEQDRCSSSWNSTTPVNCKKLNQWLFCEIERTVTCEMCGREFQDFPSNHRKFCSRECYWRALKKRKPPNFGKHYTLSEEAKKNISEGLKKAYREGKRRPVKRKPFLLTSPKDIEKIRLLYLGEKLSIRKVAERLKVSDHTILNRMKTHHIKSRPAKQAKLVDKDSAKLLHLLYVQQGFSSRKVAEKLGVCHSTVLKHLRYHGIPVRVKPTTQEISNEGNKLNLVSRVCQVK